MEIINQYVVFYIGHPQILFETDNGFFFITSTGAFNQRDMYLENIGKEQAEKLIAKTTDGLTTK